LAEALIVSIVRKHAVEVSIIPEVFGRSNDVNFFDITLGTNDSEIL